MPQIIATYLSWVDGYFLFGYVTLFHPVIYKYPESVNKWGTFSVHYYIVATG